MDSPFVDVQDVSNRRKCRRPKPRKRRNRDVCCFFFREPLEAVFPAMLDERMILKSWCDRPDKKCKTLINPQDPRMTYLQTIHYKNQRVMQVNMQSSHGSIVGKNYLTDVRPA